MSGSSGKLLTTARARTVAAAALPLLAVLFLLLVWPTPWHEDRLRGAPVRVHRFTNEVHVRSGGRWKSVGEDNAAKGRAGTVNPSQAQLRQIDARVIETYPHLPRGIVRIRAVNKGGEPIGGDVQFHFTVTGPDRVVRSDRLLRGFLRAGPRQTVEFDFRSGLTFTERDTVTVALQPASMR